MERSELVRALRCAATGMDERVCESCPFYQKEELPEYMTDTYPDDFLCSCDTNRIALMAADLIEEQAREIEALRKQNENLQATATKFATELQPKPQWVSVTERLPEPGKRVLATDGGFVGEFYLSERGQWKRYNVNDHSLLMALDILWWTNFPEAPKEGT